VALLTRKLPQGGARTPPSTQVLVDQNQTTEQRKAVQKPAPPIKPTPVTRPPAYDIKPEPVQKPPPNTKPGPVDTLPVHDIKPGGGAQTGGVNTGNETGGPAGIRPVLSNDPPQDPNVALGANLWGVETLFGRRGLHRVYGPAANRPDPVNPNDPPPPVDDGTGGPPPVGGGPGPGTGTNPGGGPSYTPPPVTTGGGTDPDPRGGGDGDRDGDPGTGAGTVAGGLVGGGPPNVTPGVHLADPQATQGSEPWAWHQITTALPNLGDEFLRGDNAYDSQVAIQNYLAALDDWFNSDATANYSPELMEALAQRMSATRDQLIQQFTNTWSVAYGFAPTPTNATTGVNPDNTGPDGDNGAAGGALVIPPIEPDLGGGR